jgi:hypothetical protein
MRMLLYSCLITVALMFYPYAAPASWTQIFIYGESRRIMQYIVVRSPRC